MLLTKTFDANSYARALESWDWIELKEKVPVLASLFGDLFLQDRDGYWFLDSIEGSLSRIATTRAEIQALLDSEAGQDRYLLGALAMAAERRGLELGASQVYNFSVAPILGGKIDVDNIVVMDFVVSLNIAGQLHGQVRKLPPGTRISGVEMKK